MTCMMLCLLVTREMCVECCVCVSDTDNVCGMVCVRVCVCAYVRDVYSVVCQ